MSRNKIQLCCGVVLIILPFLGFPHTVNTCVYILIGITLIILSGVGHFKRRSQALAEDSH